MPRPKGSKNKPKVSERVAVTAQIDELDELANGDVNRVLLLVLWKLRMVNPELSVTIDEKDIAALQQCADFLKVTPAIRIVRPQGRPATPQIAVRNKIIPAREAEPPKPFVVVHIVNKGTADTIRPIENNEHDFDRQQAAGRAKAAREKIPSLANMVMSQIQSGDFSTALVGDLCNEAMAMVRA